MYRNMVKGLELLSSKHERENWDSSPPFLDFFHLGARISCTSSKGLFYFFFFNFYFLAVPCGMWDLSYPTRDQTCAPCIGSMES